MVAVPCGISQLSWRPNRVVRLELGEGGARGEHDRVQVPLDRRICRDEVAAKERTPSATAARGPARPRRCPLLTRPRAQRPPPRSRRQPPTRPSSGTQVRPRLVARTGRCGCSQTCLGRCQGSLSGRTGSIRRRPGPSGARPRPPGRRWSDPIKPGKPHVQLEPSITFIGKSYLLLLPNLRPFQPCRPRERPCPRRCPARR